MKILKNTKTNELQKVDDKTANNMVGLTWVYAPKSEWKLATRKSEPSRNQVGTKSVSDKDQIKTNKKSNQKN